MIPGRAVRDFITMTGCSGRVSCRKVFYSLLVLLLLLRFSFFFVASDTFEGDAGCSPVGKPRGPQTPRLYSAFLRRLVRFRP